jgi:hypothetical protein
MFFLYILGHMSAFSVYDKVVSIPNRSCIFGGLKMHKSFFLL